jgi:hypothetical protein
VSTPPPPPRASHYRFTATSCYSDPLHRGCLIACPELSTEDRLPTSEIRLHIAINVVSRLNAKRKHSRYRSRSSRFTSSSWTKSSSCKSRWSRGWWLASSRSFLVKKGSLPFPWTWTSQVLWLWGARWRRGSLHP